MLKASLEWLQFSLDLGWNMADPVRASVAGKDRRAARAGREQATPYTHGVVEKLLHFHQQAEGAEQYAAGFALVLAMAVLRLSDLDRSKDVKLNDDALYGTTWRSKSKSEGILWAMPRHAWSGYDIGGTHFRQAADLFKGKGDRSWQWPAMYIERAP